ncbi:hypothetical protein F9946_12075, partial [Burkholderia thailandensis]|nr:hypothetical protein [Burkholderia thailandensis]
GDQSRLAHDALRQFEPPPACAETLGLRHFNFAQMRHYNFALTNHEFSFSASVKFSQHRAIISSTTSIPITPHSFRLK